MIPLRLNRPFAKNKRHFVKCKICKNVEGKAVQLTYGTLTGLSHAFSKCIVFSPSVIHIESVPPVLKEKKVFCRFNKCMAVVC
uniref:Uncharacterized protein n=1 Tax=Pyxicephalus adspersus TaxID=30357 RepID=A0AAV3AWD4_PYXAD|nr:TPA: hypothetical protein GDO54_008875 [Pyxicephalus adspersus]